MHRSKIWKLLLIYGKVDHYQNNNVHRIKKNTLIAPIELGGLGMIDVRICNITAKGTLIRRLLGPESSKWKTLTWYMLNINNIT